MSLNHDSFHTRTCPFYVRCVLQCAFTCVCVYMNGGVCGNAGKLARVCTLTFGYYIPARCLVPSLRSVSPSLCVCLCACPNFLVFL